MPGTGYPPLAPPPVEHDRYRAAEMLRDTYDAVEMVYVNPNKCIPGDSVTDFTRAWEYQEPDGPAHQLGEHIQSLVHGGDPQLDYHFQQEGLTGPVGAFKRNGAKGLLDHAYRLLRPGKDRQIDLNLITPQERKLGLEVLGEYFEAAATYIKSIFPAANAVVEFLSFLKQACKAAAKWL